MKTSRPLPIWQQIILWGTGSISLIIILLFWGIWQTGDRTLNAIEGLFKPESKVEMSTLIVQQIKGMQELTTTVYTMETVVPTSADRKLGEFSLGTTKLLYIAHGEVRAGIDLSQLKPDDIKLTNNTIQIDLPPAKILDSKVDVARSRVYDYDRGFFNLGPDVAPQLQTLAQKKTLEQIIENACKEDILKTANQRAEKTISELLDLSGYQQITIKTASSSLQSCYSG